MTKWTPENVPNCFYRVSVKALILNEARDKFLIVQESDGKWETPGGGLDFGEMPNECLTREISEEMGLEVVRVAENPSYFTTGTKSGSGYWNVGVVYEVELENFDFTPTDECQAIKFIGKEDEGWLRDVGSFDNVQVLLGLFDQKFHQR